MCIQLYSRISYIWDPRWLSGKESACQCRRCRLDPWVRKIPWRRASLPTPVFLPGESPWTEETGGLQCMGSQSQTGLKQWSTAQHNVCSEVMATYSSVLAWRIPGTGEPGGLPSMGSHGVGHDWSELAAAAAASKSRKLLTLLRCIL